MSISANRFKILDKETNVAVSNFTDPKSSDIYTSPNLVVKDLSKDVENFLIQSSASLSLSLTPTKDQQDSLLRKAKDSYSSMKDVKSLSQADLDKLIAGLFPNSPTAASAYKQLSADCRTGPMSRYNSGKLFDPTLNCGGSLKKGVSSGCSPSAYSNVLDKLTGGAYSSTYSDLNQALSNIVALATNGYNMNFCGVFTALTGGAGGLVNSRAASMLLGSLGTSSNLRGVFDLAKSTLSSDFHIMKEIPNGISNVFDNFKKPLDTKEVDYSSTTDAIGLSMETFDLSWNKSYYDGIASTRNIQTYSTDLNSVMRGKAMDHSVDEDHLDAIPDDSTNSLRCGLNSTTSSLPEPEQFALA